VASAILIVCAAETKGLALFIYGLVCCQTLELNNPVGECHTVPVVFGDTLRCRASLPEPSGFLRYGRCHAQPCRVIRSAAPWSEASCHVSAAMLSNAGRTLRSNLWGQSRFIHDTALVCSASCSTNGVTFALQRHCTLARARTTSYWTSGHSWVTPLTRRSVLTRTSVVVVCVLINQGGCPCCGCMKFLHSMPGWTWCAARLLLRTVTRTN